MENNHRLGKSQDYGRHVALHHKPSKGTVPLSNINVLEHGKFWITGENVKFSAALYRDISFDIFDWIYTLFTSLDSAFKILIFIVFDVNMHIQWERKGVNSIQQHLFQVFQWWTVCVGWAILCAVFQSVRPFSFHFSYNINKPSALQESLTDAILTLAEILLQPGSHHLTKLQFYRECCVQENVSQALSVLDESNAYRVQVLFW